MLLIFQYVFYSLKTLTVTELRYLVVFGLENFSLYSEWEQSNNYIINDINFEKRIRDKSRGLIEIAEVPENKYQSTP